MNVDSMKLKNAIEYADQQAKKARAAYLKSPSKENQLLMDNWGALQDSLFSLGCHLHGLGRDIATISVKDAWAVKNG